MNPLCWLVDLAAIIEISRFVTIAVVIVASIILLSSTVRICFVALSEFEEESPSAGHVRRGCESHRFSRSPKWLSSDDDVDSVIGDEDY